MKPEDKNLDKALNEDELDAVSGGVFAKKSTEDAGGSTLASSIRVCSVQSDSNGSDAFAANNK